ERLQDHAKAFESLLALTPAREYYGSHTVDGQDPSEQWSRKKQTKQEKAAAKKAKLDPANNKSALDVMKERELKRKRELGIANEDESPEDANSDAPRSKKHKAEISAEEAEEKRKRKVEIRKEKRQKKQEKNAQKKNRLEEKKAAKQNQDPGDAATWKPNGVTPETTENDPQDSDDDANENAGLISHNEMENIDFSGLGGTDDDHHSDASSAPSSAAVDSPAFDVSANHSTASSSSSIVPPTETEKPAKQQQHSVQPGSTLKPKVLQQKSLPSFQSPSDAVHVDEAASGSSSPKPSIPKIDGAALQERLRARIEELRAKRKADGMGSRQDLLEQRRQKGEQRKAHKKELRRKAKEDEVRKQDERLRGSGSPLASPDIFSPQARSENFSFGRVGFEDGTTVNSDLTGLQDARKRKGPQDAKTALIAAQNKEKRISGYDNVKKSDIAEKDSWLNATKRAHGAKVRDDTSLLRKALKRKEKQKSKSEKEWKEREDNVVKGKEMKQKKREANLQRRKDEKGQKGKKKPAKGGKKGRPGFEGRFKA
ncbi:SURF6-domain-containing protein, partial [Polychaeton citri CBS 116435]